MAGGTIRWDPVGDLAQLRGRFDRLLDDLGDRPGSGWAPAIDVVREDDALVLRADVPGMKPEDIKVEVEGGVLTVTGEHEEELQGQDGQKLHSPPLAAVGSIRPV